MSILVRVSVDLAKKGKLRQSNCQLVGPIKATVNLARANVTPFK